MTRAAELAEPDAYPSARRLKLLLKVSDALIAAHDLSELLAGLRAALHPVTPSDSYALTIRNPAGDGMVAHVVSADTGAQMKVFSEDIGGDFPSTQVIGTGRPIVVADWETERRWPALREFVLAQGGRSCAVLPLTTARGTLGVIAFYSRTPETYEDPREVEVLSQITAQVAVAVENVQNLAAADALREALRRDRDRLRLSLELTNVTVTEHDPAAVFTVFARRLRAELDLRFMSLSEYRPGATPALLLLARDPGMEWGGLALGDAMDMDDSLSGRAIRSRAVAVANRAEIETWPGPTLRRLYGKGIRSMCSVPLTVADRVLGGLTAGAERDRAFDDSETVECLRLAGGQLAVALANAMAFREIAALKEKLSQEKVYLEDEVRTAGGFDEIVGQSDAVRKVLAQVDVVAGTDATVLVCGETGTGKELIARAIHRHSPRRDRTFVKVNCAAIPAGLLESELFGHEKGAFTGATSQRVGRFELADGGTLFLDEIGDMPLELQPKLLRVLQEMEFERVGGTRTLRTDVRIVAATHRDLKAMAAAKEFREDLYYRLNVFPIRLPPLRDRAGDLPLLVSYFARRAAEKLGRRIEEVPAADMHALARHAWPGNLRELQNFVERAVIVSTGPTLKLPVVELEAATANPTPQSTANDSPPTGQSLDGVQREHILRVLRQARWVIGGPEGAAAKLGMKRTTLQSRMRKLGIARPV